MDRIKGLVYGTIIGDIVGTKYKGKDFSNAYTVEYSDIEMASEWTGISDRMIIIMNNITQSHEYINVFTLAEKLCEWQEKGITELPPRSDRHIGMHLNFVLKQKDYLTNPIKSSKKSYKITGSENAPNDALACNAVCGILKKWHKNTILHTTITTYDSRCIVSCLVHSFIINCMFWNKPINWKYINPICQNIITKHKINKTQNSIEYNKHLYMALNYTKYLESKAGDDECESGYLSFLKKLNIGNYNNNDNQTYALIGMVISIITIIDIQFEINRNRRPSTEYYVRRICETASCGGDAITNCAIVGSIIGVFIGFDEIPVEWIKKINNRDWLDLKIDAFYNKIRSP